MPKGIVEGFVGAVVDEVRSAGSRVARGAVRGAIREGQAVARSIEQKLEELVGDDRVPEREVEVVEVRTVSAEPKGAKRCEDLE